MKNFEVITNSNGSNGKTYVTVKQCGKVVEEHKLPFMFMNPPEPKKSFTPLNEWVEKNRKRGWVMDSDGNVMYALRLKTDVDEYILVDSITREPVSKAI